MEILKGYLETSSVLWQPREWTSWRPRHLVALSHITACSRQYLRLVDRCSAPGPRVDVVATLDIGGCGYYVARRHGASALPLSCASCADGAQLCRECMERPHAHPYHAARTMQQHGELVSLCLRAH